MMNNNKDLIHWVRALQLLAAAFVLMLGLGVTQAHAQGAVRTYDHVKTGFLLTGVHASQRCESCHVNGVFRGTPRDCASCHTAGARLAAQNMVKPQQHIATTLGCESCHGTVTFSGAKFNHMGVTPASCASCHNGMTATGKPAGHIATTAPCGTCHRTTAWLPATGMDHSQFTMATNCASCHNGSSATGKSATHVPTAVNCINCHNTTGWRPTKWNHTQQSVANQCATCHSGAYPPADGRPSNHIPYQALSGVAIRNCDSCHKGGFAAWFPGTFHNNVTVTTQCATCHLSGVYGLTGKPATATHASVTGNCESCHKTTSSWFASKPDHSLFTVATVCSSCHNGSSATGKPATHIPTTVNCISCHSTAAWRPSTWNHSQQSVTNQCATCHSGAYPPADGRPSNHIPYQTLSGVAITNCDSCHKAGYAAWFPGTFHNNVTVTTQCATCHLSGVYGLTSKPATATHATVTGNCESCHKTTSSWFASRPDHSLFTVATVCSSCHNGSSATGKPATHIPTTVNCISCHSTAAWRPSTWNHSQQSVVNQCATCHSGAYPPADGRPANHIPYQTLSGVAITNCDTCHKAGYAAWYPGRFHGNVSITTQCAACHLSGVYGLTSKPATTTHATVTGNCESCHRSTASWLSVQYTHSPANAVGTGTCDTCHNGVTALGKPPTHIPVPAGIAKCDSCHRSQVSFATSVSMNHSVVTTGTCKSCHNGSYLSAGVQGALAKPVNHIPEASQILNGAAMDCKDCHTSTVSWTSERMNHNSSMGSGAGWCKGCHDSGTNYLGNMQKMALNHRGGATVKVDCSQSSCHRPLGTFGAAYSKWN